MVNRNDVLYGQNWVEQLRSARRTLHFVAIENSTIQSAYSLLEHMATHCGGNVNLLYTRRRNAFVVGDLFMPR